MGQGCEAYPVCGFLEVSLSTVDWEKACLWKNRPLRLVFWLVEILQERVTQDNILKYISIISCLTQETGRSLNAALGITLRMKKQSTESGLPNHNIIFSFFLYL